MFYSLSPPRILYYYHHKAETRSPKASDLKKGKQFKYDSAASNDTGIYFSGQFRAKLKCFQENINLNAYNYEKRLLISTLERKTKDFY